MSTTTQEPPSKRGDGSYFRREVMTWPNAITSIRLICAVVMFLWPEKAAFVFGLALTGALSDAADGFVAKHFRIETKFGKRYDQYVDWLFGSAFLYVIAIQDEIVFMEWPFSGILLSLIAGYLFLRALIINVDTTVTAKIKTFLQFSGGIFILGGISFNLDLVHTGGYLLVWSSIGLMLKSLWDYCRPSARPM